MQIYIDENFPSQLAKALDILEHPNRSKIQVISIVDAFHAGIKDEAWIPLVGEKGGIVVTQDLRINRTRHQYELYKQHRLGVFFFKPPGKGGFKYWDMVLLMVKRWESLKKLARKTKQPFAYQCTMKTDFKLWE